MENKFIVDNQKIGNLIELKRKRSKLTQKRLGEMVGLSRNYIADIEAGRYTPSLNSMCRIAKILKIDLNFLLKNDGNTSSI